MQGRSAKCDHVVAHVDAGLLARFSWAFAAWGANGRDGPNRNREMERKRERQKQTNKGREEYLHRVMDERGCGARVKRQAVTNGQTRNGESGRDTVKKTKQEKRVNKERPRVMRQKRDRRRGDAGRVCLIPAMDICIA